MVIILALSSPNGFSIYTILKCPTWLACVRGMNCIFEKFLSHLSSFTTNNPISLPSSLLSFAIISSFSIYLSPLFILYLFLLFSLYVLSLSRLSSLCQILMEVRKFHHTSLPKHVIFVYGWSWVLTFSLTKYLDSLNAPSFPVSYAPLLVWFQNKVFQTCRNGRQDMRKKGEKWENIEKRKEGERKREREGDI